MMDKELMKKAVFSAAAVLIAGGLALPDAAFPQTSQQQRGRSANARVMMRRGYLGVGVADLTPDRVKALGLKDDSGVEVKHVDENSPAMKAGLKENDVILELNRQKMEDVDQFVRAISETAPGTKIEMVLWRGGGRQTVSTTLDARAATMVFMPDMPDLPEPPMPPMPPTAQGREQGLFVMQAPMIGFEGEPLGGQLAEFFGVKGGVLVRSVAPGSPAAKAGLKAGDVVTKVNAMTVMTTREIQAVVRNSRKSKVPFTVTREKKETALEVEVQQ